MKDATIQWYVVKVVGGGEQKAKEYLENEVRRMNLTDVVRQVLIPTEKVCQVKNGKKVVKEKNLYPGYIFIEAALIGEVKVIVSDAPGISGFLTDKKGGQPVPVKESEINSILGIQDESLDKPDENIIRYSVGEAVKVIDGPFKGFESTVEEVSEDGKTLKVIVKIFGRETRLELGYVQVEKE